MPRIVNPGFKVENKFGALGPEKNVTGHYTAGPVDRSTKDAVRLAGIFHRYHAQLGWGGIAYHYMIARNGTIILLRSTHLKGSHTGGHNTQNLGVVMNGSTGDRPSYRQRRSFRWLLANAHTTALPKKHRTDLDLRKAKRWGHREWSGASTACPGRFLKLYKSGGNSR